VYVGETIGTGGIRLFFVPLSSNSRRVRPHIRFRRCTSSVGAPSVLTLLVGDTAGSYSIRILVPSPLLHVYDVFDHAFPSSHVAYRSSLSGLTVLASVTLIAYIVWQYPILYCSTYRRLNTIFVLIITIIVFVLHCFDIICLLLLLRALSWPYVSVWCAHRRLIYITAALNRELYSCVLRTSCGQ